MWIFWFLPWALGTRFFYHVEWNCTGLQEKMIERMKNINVNYEPENYYALESFARDLKYQVTRILESKSFFAYKLTHEIKKISNNNYLLRFKVDAGNFFRVKKIKCFVNNEAYDKVNLKRLVGKKFKLEKFDDIINDIKKQLRNNGYMIANPLMPIDIVADHNKNELYVTIRFYTSKKTTFKDFKVVGNKRNSEEKILSFQTWNKGDFYNNESLEEYLRLLNDFHSFTNIILKEEDTFSKLILKESKYHNLGIKAGYQSETGIFSEIFFILRDPLGGMDFFKFSAIQNNYISQYVINYNYTEISNFLKKYKKYLEINLTGDFQNYKKTLNYFSDGFLLSLKATIKDKYFSYFVTDTAAEFYYNILPLSYSTDSSEIKQWLIDGRIIDDKINHLVFRQFIKITHGFRRKVFIVDLESNIGFYNFAGYEKTYEKTIDALYRQNVFDSYDSGSYTFGTFKLSFFYNRKIDKIYKFKSVLRLGFLLGNPPLNYFLFNGGDGSLRGYNNGSLGKAVYRPDGSSYTINGNRWFAELALDLIEKKDYYLDISTFLDVGIFFDRNPLNFLFGEFPKNVGLPKDNVSKAGIDKSKRGRVPVQSPFCEIFASIGFGVTFNFPKLIKLKFEIGFPFPKRYIDYSGAISAKILIV